MNNEKPNTNKTKHGCPGKGGGCKCGSKQNPAKVLKDMANETQSTDVLGSYTGTPADGGLPQQDADDL